MLGTKEGQDIDTSIDYNDPENLKYKTKVRESDQKDYEEWKNSNNLQETDEYDLPGVYYSSGKENPSEIKGLHPDTGMLLMSPNHPDYRAELESQIGKNKQFYINPHDKRIYLNSRNVEEGTGYLEELPSKTPIVNKSIEDEVDEILSNVRNVSGEHSQRLLDEYEFKKKQPISERLAQMIPAKETAGKTKASQLYRKAGSSQGAHQLTDIAISELQRKGLVGKIDRNNLDESMLAAMQYIDGVIKPQVKSEDPEILLAAYNAGPTKVLRAIKNANKRGVENPTYEDIRDELSSITQEYVETANTINKGKDGFASFDFDEYAKSYKNDIPKARKRKATKK